MATSVETEIEALLDGFEPICEEAVRRLTSSPSPYYPIVKAITFRGSRPASGMSSRKMVNSDHAVTHTSLVSGWRLGVEPFILTNLHKLMFLHKGVALPQFMTKKLEFASPVSAENTATIAHFLSPEHVRDVIDELATFVYP